MKDFELCLCNKIMRSTLIRLIEDRGLTILAEVQIESKAGTTCGGCIPDIEELLTLLNKNKNDNFTYKN